MCTPIDKPNAITLSSVLSLFVLQIYQKKHSSREEHENHKRVTKKRKGTDNQLSTVMYRNEIEMVMEIQRTSLMENCKQTSILKKKKMCD